MPVSKKRKKKGQRASGPPQPKNQAKPQKLTMQRILLYIISGVMILSLAASFLVGAGGGHNPTNVQAPVQIEGQDNLLDDVEAPASEASESDTEAETEDGGEGDN